MTAHSDSGRRLWAGLSWSQSTRHQAIDTCSTCVPQGVLHALAHCKQTLLEACLPKCNHTFSFTHRRLAALKRPCPDTPTPTPQYLARCYCAVCSAHSLPWTAACCSMHACCMHMQPHISAQHVVCSCPAQLDAFLSPGSGIPIPRHTHTIANITCNISNISQRLHAHRVRQKTPLH